MVTKCIPFFGKGYIFLFRSFRMQTGILHSVFHIYSFDTVQIIRTFY